MTSIKLCRASSLVAALSGLVALFAACSEGEAETPEDAPKEDAGGDAFDPGEPRDGAGARDGADASGDADAIEARTCTAEGWCHTVLPPDQVLRSVWSDGQGVAWAVTDQGNILRYDGAAWSTHHARGAVGALFSIWGSGPTDIWVGGKRTFLHGTGTSPAAITWIEVPLDASVTGESVVSIYGASAGDIYAATGPELLHYTSGGGWTIDPVTQREDVPKFTAIWGRPGHDDIWISTLSTMYQMSVLMQRPGGAPPGSPWSYALGVSEVPISKTYCNTPGEPRRGAMVADGEIWLIGTRQYYGIDDCFFYFHGTKGTEPPIYSFSGHVLIDSYLKHNDIWGASKDDVWLVGDHGTLQHWDGTSWRAAAISVTNLPVLNDFHAIGGRAPGDVWVVGDRIALHKVTP